MKAKHLIGFILLCWIIWFIFLDAFINKKKEQLLLEQNKKIETIQEVKEPIIPPENSDVLVEQVIDDIQLVPEKTEVQENKVKGIKFEEDNTIKITNTNGKELSIKFYYDDRGDVDDLHGNNYVDKSNTAFLKELNSAWEKESFVPGFQSLFFSSEVTEHISEELLNFMIKFSYDIFDNINVDYLDKNNYELAVVIKDNPNKKGKRWGFSELSDTSWQLNLYINNTIRTLPYSNEWKNIFIHEMWHFVDLVLMKDVTERKSLDKGSFYSLCWIKDKENKIIMKEECDKLSMFSWYAKSDMYEDFAESFLTYILFYNELSKKDLTNFPILKRKLILLRNVLPPLEKYQHSISDENLDSILFGEHYAFYKLEEVFI